jgi:hypothetical protein
LAAKAGVCTLISLTSPAQILVFLFVILNSLRYIKTLLDLTPPIPKAH